MRRLLIVFSYKYPFSPPVEQFLHMEMPYHCDENTDIWFLPYARDYSTEKYNISELKNVTVKPIPRRNKYTELLNGGFELLCNLKSTVSEVLSIIQDKEAKKKTQIVTFFRSAIQSYGLFQEIKKTLAPELLKGYSEIVLYSYWLNPMAAAICHYKRFLGKYGIQNVHAIARAHGQGDLYLEPDTGTYRPNARLLSNYLDMVYSISENGMHHLESQGLSRVTVSRLGVSIPNFSAVESPKQSEGRLIVSCSVINENKRVLDIAKAIALLKAPARWVHFGSGPEEQQVIQWCTSNMPNHISWKVNGWTANADVIAFYKEYRPDVFVNLSYVEGIPVSIMEAMSCGIPCVATDTGASSEIVRNGVNGYLVPRNFEIGEVSRNIEKCLNGECIDLKDEARKIAAVEYSAEKNFQKFSDEIWKLKKGGVNK